MQEIDILVKIRFKFIIYYYYFIYLIQFSILFIEYLH